MLSVLSVLSVLNVPSALSALSALSTLSALSVSAGVVLSADGTEVEPSLAPNHCQAYVIRYRRHAGY